MGLITLGDEAEAQRLQPEQTYLIEFLPSVRSLESPLVKSNLIF